MRTCIRCQTNMIENCGIKAKGAYGIEIWTPVSKWWGGGIEEVKEAVCPNCGEVSIYIEDVSKLKENEK